MTAFDLLFAIGEADDTLVEAAHTVKTHRPQRAIISGLCAALILGIAIAVYAAFPKTPPSLDPLVDVPAQTEGAIDATAVPADKPQNGKQVVSAETAYVWPWDCQGVYEQFPSLTFDGISYTSRASYSGQALAADMLGAFLGTATAEGYDLYEDTVHTTACTVFSINELDPSRYIAVRYEGHEEAYPFYRSDYAPLPTLGDMMTAMHFEETAVITSVYIDDEEYDLLPEDGRAVWQLLRQGGQAAVIPSMSDEERQAEATFEETAVSFGVSCETVGITVPRSLSISTAGYLSTNLEDYGYHFAIGPETAQAIRDYVLAHVTAPAPEKAPLYLVGTVTEIGDGCLLIDDSVMMRDPADGTEYTVYAEDIRVSRYIRSGFLQVGQTVRITYDAVDPVSSTVITTATALEEVTIVDATDDVLIPE